MRYEEVTSPPEVCVHCAERLECLKTDGGEGCCEECEHLMERFVEIEDQ